MALKKLMIAAMLIASFAARAATIIGNEKQVVMMRTQTEACASLTFNKIKEMVPNPVLKSITTNGTMRVLAGNSEMVTILTVKYSVDKKLFTSTCMAVIEGVYSSDVAVPAGNFNWNRETKEWITSN